MAETKLSSQALARASLQSGWIDPQETWTYASATTITVPSGAAARYRKGDKIQIKQTTVKYFYIIGVADTTLTVTGGSDYSVANAAITDNYFSHVSTPTGFPTYFNFTLVNFTTSGTAFTNQPTTSTLRFSIVDGICKVWILGLTNATSGGTGIIYANITSGHLPTRIDAEVGTAFNLNDGTAGVSWTQATNVIAFVKYDGTVLVGSSKYFVIDISYLF